MDEQDVNVTQLLPDDVLGEILSRLAPRWLAASRCVCKAWHDVIDSRRLLRADLLPLSLGGIYFNFYDERHSVFLSRPSTRPFISGMFTDYTPNAHQVEDHCNGLLLLSYGVANPATRQWMPFPPPPPSCTGIKGIYQSSNYLTYDPTISSHYEVFQIPHAFDRELDELDTTDESSQWPPSPNVLNVFSSRTGKWKKRSYVREGEAAGTVADMALSFPNDQFNGVYWQGALYVHCEADFIMRISLSDNTYKVIRLPITTEVSEYKTDFFGRSKNGVHYALKDKDQRLRVWFLNESCGQKIWELKHDKNISFLLKRHDKYVQNDGPWTLHYFDYCENYDQNDIDAHYEGYRNEDYNKEYIAGQDYNHFETASYLDRNESNNGRVIVPINKFEWDSDNDSILDIENMNDERCDTFFSILGFHPYKEVIFLNRHMDRGLAYHFNSSKIQYLGKTFPKCYQSEVHEMYASFVYTPCWIGELSKST
uniref:F-box domain-containing protein n=1 Tax=Oryza punctata TaxID=4537 RepID=A0A0E0KHE9_ORYPU